MNPKPLQGKEYPWILAAAYTLSSTDSFDSKEGTLIHVQWIRSSW
jgi:hypothetical protein